MIRIHRRQRGQGILLVRAHRNLYLAALQKLKKLLLHGLPAHIPGREVLLSGNLINLVNKDDTVLRFLHIIVRRSQKLGHHALNIIADIARLCQGRRVRHGQRHVKKPGQGLYQIRLPAPRRPQHQNIRLFNLNLPAIALLSLQEHALIMVIYRHGDRLLRPLLSDNILIQTRFYPVRSRNILHGKFRLLLFRPLFLNLILLRNLRSPRRKARNIT